MAEWSKAMDSSPITERCVGSNPTGTIFSYYQDEIERTSFSLYHLLKNFIVQFKIY